MSFFGRVGNLARGWLKTRTSARPGLDEAGLEEELARPRPVAAQRPRAEKPAETPTPRGPERDEHGNIKKTL